jgi:hypothetical protein
MCLGNIFDNDCPIPSILFEIGGDGVQIHTFGKRTVCVIGIRCLDLPQHLAHTAHVYQAVFIIEGKKEKKALSGVLEIITNEVMQHYPPAGALSYAALLSAQLPDHGGHNILLLAGGADTTPLTVFNGHTRAQEQIYLVLGRATGDNPFISSLAASPGAAAYKGCKDCFVVGQKVGGKDATRFADYCEPTSLAVIKIDGRWEDDWTHQLVDADDILNDLGGELFVTHEKHLMRAALAKKILEDAKVRCPPCTTGVRCRSLYTCVYERDSILRVHRLSGCPTRVLCSCNING